MENKDFEKKESNFFIEKPTKNKKKFRTIKKYKEIKSVKKINFLDNKINLDTKLIPNKRINFSKEEYLTSDYNSTKSIKHSLNKIENANVKSKISSDKKIDFIKGENLNTEHIPKKSKKYASKTIGSIKAIYKGMKAIDDELDRNENDQKESLGSKIINSGDNFIYVKDKVDNIFNFFDKKEKLIDKSEIVSSEKFIFSDTKLKKKIDSNKKINKLKLKKNESNKKLKKFKPKNNKRKVGINTKEITQSVISGTKKIGAIFIKTLKLIIPKLLIPTLLLVVLISTFAIFIGGFNNNHTINQNNETIPSTKSVEEFLDQYGNSFMYVANEYNLYASVMIAQAGIESAWGSSIIGNNLFGIKCYNREYGCIDNLTTNEEVDGKIVTIKDSFQLSPEGGKIGAIKLYVDFLYNGSSFPKYSRKLTKTYHKTYKSAVNSLITDLKYATDLSYIDKIINVIETYNLTKYDTNEKSSYPELKNIVLNRNINIDLSSMINKTGLPVNVKREDIDKYITFHFGYRINPVHGGEDFHKGIDIVMPLDTPIYATHDGQVVHAHSSGTYNGGYGNAVFIKNGNVETRYAHLNSTVVREGQFVKVGTLIGYMGNTGQSSGAHLHYEYRINGDPIDPYKTFK